MISIPVFSFICYCSCVLLSSINIVLQLKQSCLNAALYKSKAKHFPSFYFIRRMKSESCRFRWQLLRWSFDYVYAFVFIGCLIYYLYRMLSFISSRMNETDDGNCAKNNMREAELAHTHMWQTFIWCEQINLFTS